MKNGSHYTKLEVWTLSRKLANTIYAVTKNYPESEKFGLTNQLRRCAVSVPSNIAEGCGRTGDNELKHFLTISLGSAFELETQAGTIQSCPQICNGCEDPYLDGCTNVVVDCSDPIYNPYSLNHYLYIDIIFHYL